MNWEERELVKLVVGEVGRNGYAMLDGETARKIGRLLSRRELRGLVIIANDRRQRKSVLLGSEDALKRLVLG